MTADQNCPRCGARLLGDPTEALCAACLLRAAQELTTTAGDATVAGTAVLVGTRVRYVGDYELLEEIARGGMGVVFKARQISLNRLVAVKMILSGHLADDEDVRRFRAEAEAAANLQHPNIVAIHEVGEHDGHHYFSMDYVEGRNLAQLADGRPLPADQAARYVKIMAEAIQFAHQRGILHRDLKPQNVLIDAHDQPRITDFGLAKRIHDTPAVTVPNLVMGTPSYMSPEQAAGAFAGPASDVYSLGAVLYELLTGRPPFRGESAMATMRAVIENPPVAPHTLNAGVSRDLETIALKCLEKRIDLRYHTAGDFAEDLGRFLNRDPIHAKPATVGRKVVAWSRRHPSVFTAVASAAIVVLLGLVDYLWEETRYLRWVAGHTGYVQLPGPRTAWLKRWDWLSSLLNLPLLVCGLFVSAWLPFSSSRRAFLRVRPLKPFLVPVFGAIGVVGMAQSLYAITRVISAHVWEGYPVSWETLPQAFFPIYLSCLVLSGLAMERRAVARGAPIPKPLTAEQLQRIRGLEVTPGALGLRTTHLSESLVDAIRDGNKTEAIRLYRHAAAVDLKQAKNVIESIWP